MEFHAWINPYRVKTSLKNQLAPEHIYHQHPEWFVTYGDQLYFDPALPESRDYICKIVTDIVSRYDVDAIHMDDYFYPYPVKGMDFPDDASFARYGGGFTNKADWRRSNVNVLINPDYQEFLKNACYLDRPGYADAEEFQQLIDEEYTTFEDYLKGAGLI